MSVHPEDLAEVSELFNFFGEHKRELYLYEKKVKSAVFLIKTVQCVCVWFGNRKEQEAEILVQNSRK